jgi:K+-sensing histidine kinase KdpD
MLGRDLPLLEFDAVLIERVFCNLLENAAKYAPEPVPQSSIVAVQARTAQSSKSRCS